MRPESTNACCKDMFARLRIFLIEVRVLDAAMIRITSQTVKLCFRRLVVLIHTGE